MHLYYNVIMVIAVGKLLRNCYQLSTGKDFFTGHKLIGPEAEKEARHLLEMIFRTAIAAAATAAIYQASRRMPSKNYSIGAQCAGVILTALIGLKFSKYIAGSGWIAAAYFIFAQAILPLIKTGYRDIASASGLLSIVKGCAKGCGKIFLIFLAAIFSLHLADRGYEWQERGFTRGKIVLSEHSKIDFSKPNTPQSLRRIDNYRIVEKKFFIDRMVNRLSRKLAPYLARLLGYRYYNLKGKI